MSELTQRDCPHLTRFYAYGSDEGTDMKENSSDNILTYDSVEISYTGKPVVHDISFTLKKGEILGIVGESGSGKSTIIKAAMGLLGDNGLVTKGDIWFEGMNLPDISEKQMRQLCGPKLGMIFQNAIASMTPIRTVGSQIFESMKEHGDVTKEEFEKQACDMLKKINLPDGKRVLDSYPFELSGGMNQRVAICMAMLMNPKILLADEPTSALDVSVQKRVVEEMVKARDTFGTSIIIVTHNIGVVRAMCDTCLVLKDGHIMEYGEAKQVIEAPRDEYTKQLMDAVPKLKVI